MNVAFIMQVEENDDPFKYTLRGWRADAQAHRYWLFVTDAMGEAFTIELEVDIEPNRIPREPERVVFRDGLTWLETDFEAFSVGSWSRRVPMDTELPSFGPDHTAIIAAVREEGATTRGAFSDTWRGLLEKVGIVPKRARWPRVSSNAKNRAAAMWKAWPETRLDAQAGGEKVDCWEFHRRELAGFGIISVEHFKAVLDKARK